MALRPLRWEVLGGSFSFARYQAEKCQRLAGNSTDPFTRERSLKLAGDYLARADEEDRDQTYR